MEETALNNSTIFPQKLEQFIDNKDEQFVDCKRLYELKTGIILISEEQKKNQGRPCINAFVASF